MPFYGYYDQTDIFFKMAKALSINTQTLDEALSYKRSVDVPYFSPPTQFLVEKNGGKTMTLKNASLFSPRLMKEDETYFWGRGTQTLKKSTPQTTKRLGKYCPSRFSFAAEIIKIYCG